MEAHHTKVQESVGGDHALCWAVCHGVSALFQDHHQGALVPSRRLLFRSDEPAAGGKVCCGVCHLVCGSVPDQSAAGKACGKIIPETGITGFRETGLADLLCRHLPSLASLPSVALSGRNLLGHPVRLPGGTGDGYAGVARHLQPQPDPLHTDHPRDDSDQPPLL